MAHADYHSGLLTVFCQRKVCIVLRSQRNIFNQSLSGVLVPLELLNESLCDGFRRLGSLVIHIEIRSLEMNSEDLGSLITIIHHRCHIGHSLLQYIRHLSHRSRKNGGNAFLRYVFHPVA